MHLEADSRPFVTTFGWESAPGVFTFFGVRGFIDLAAPSDLVTAVLQRCTGHTTVREIQATAGVDPADVLGLLRALSAHGVVIDSQRAFQGFDALSANPPPFLKSLSARQLTLLQDRAERALHKPRGANAIRLPRGESLLTRNATCRHFSGEPVRLDVLANLLRSMYGPTSGSRAVPSAGGLYPLNVDIVIARSHPDLEMGRYSYFPLSDCLVRSEAPVFRETLLRALDSESLVDGAGALLFLTADIGVPAEKYGNRAYRYVLLEAGHVAQNAALFCAASGLGLLEYGGYLDSQTLVALGMAADERSVLIVLGVGWPDVMNEDDPESPEQLRDRLVRSLVGPKRVIESLALHPGTGNDDADVCVSVAHYRNPRVGAYQYARTSVGTDYTVARAQIAAIAEGVERFASGRLRIDETGAEKDLGEVCLSPDQISPLSMAQRRLLGLASYSSSAEWTWVAGTTFDGQRRLVAVDNVFYPLSQRQARHAPCWQANSSGVAAFETREGAQLRAILELIERDAFLVTWYARRPVRELRASSLSPFLASRQAAWQAKGYDLQFLDLTLDSAPVVLAILISSTAAPCFSAGASAATNIRAAADKAMREAEASVWTLGKGDCTPISDPTEIRSPEDHGRYYLDPRRLRDLDWLLSGKVVDAMDGDIGAVDAAGLMAQFEAVAIDLGVASIPQFAVVRMVSPRLLPMTFGYGADLRRHPRLQTLGLQWDWGEVAAPHFFS